MLAGYALSEYHRPVAIVVGIIAGRSGLAVTHFSAAWSSQYPIPPRAVVKSSRKLLRYMDFVARAVL